MDEKILLKDDVGKLYNELEKEYKFYAPTKVKGNIAFSKISNPEEIELDYLNSKVPPKDVLFPQKETIFEYRYEGKDVVIEERKDLEDKLLIFGVRPCDAYSFQLFANFFKAHGDWEDEIYLKKKENTTIIGIGCNSPKTTCFCTSVGGHPFQKDYIDLFLTDLGDKYKIEGLKHSGVDQSNSTDYTLSDYFPLGIGHWWNYSTIINGTFDWVYEEEFDIIEGWHWSPDGKHIAYWQIDEREVPEYEIPLFNSLYPKNIIQKYPKAGQNNSKVKIGVVNAIQVNDEGIT